jgi:hypothetical protein
VYVDIFQKIKAKYTDNKWYEARIESTIKEDGKFMYLVTYTEYGNSEYVGESDIKKSIPSTPQTLPSNSSSSSKIISKHKYSKGDILQGKYTEDDEWYECEIVDLIGENRYLVEYTEYGNSEELTEDRLKPIYESSTVLQPS